MHPHLCVPQTLVVVRPIFNKLDETSGDTSQRGSVKVKREHAGNIGEASKTMIFVGSLADDTTEVVLVLMK